MEIKNVPEGLSLPIYSITYCIFSHAINGAIEGYDVMAEIYFEKVLFVDNRRPKEVKKGILELINTHEWIQIMDCRFINNYGSMITGSVLNIQKAAEVMFSNFTLINKWYNGKDFSPLKVVNTTIIVQPIGYPTIIFFLYCPPSTSIDFFSKINTFEYYCLPFKSFQYSTQNQYVTIDFNPKTFQTTFLKVVPPKFVCPWQAVCTTRGVQSKGNFWGYLGNRSNEEMAFFSCPSFFCCEQIETCQSFDRCRHGRVGRLCGRCPSNHSMSLFNQYSCFNIQDSDCSNSIFWILTIFLSALVIITVAYSDKIFLFLNHLEQRQDSIKITTKGYRVLKDLDHPNRVGELTPTEILDDSNGDGNKDININENNLTNSIAERNSSNEVPHLRSIYGSIEKTEHNNSNEPPNNIRNTEHNNTNEPPKNIRNAEQNNSNEPARNIGNAEQNNSNEQRHSEHYQADELQLCLTNEPPTEPNKPRASWQGMMVILFYFYPAVGLLLTNNSVSTSPKKLILTEMISSFFSVKLQTPSISVDGCLIENTGGGMFQVESLKASILFVSLFMLLIALSAGIFYRKLRRANLFSNDNHRNNNETVNPKKNENHRNNHDNTDWNQVFADANFKPSFELRIKISYTRLLCYGYTTTTVWLLNYVHCISIGNV